jgi:PAS domain S-box-containing protein
MLHGHHPIYVIISVLVAILGSATALALHRRVAVQGSSRARQAWLAATAVAMGLSIWSMHFIAMLGYNAGVPVSYDALLTIGSLLLAIGSTAIAFVLVDRHRWPIGSFLLGALFMGTGICSMHYVGMAAIRAPARISYDPQLVALSLLLAVAASFAALLVAARAHSIRLRAASAIGLGFAIFGMHYTGMGAARFVRLGAAHFAGPIDNALLGVAVATATLIILLLGLVAAMFDLRIERMANREARAAAARETYFRTLLGALPTAVVVVDAENGIVQYANPEAVRLAGCALADRTFPSAETLLAERPGGSAFATGENPAARARAGERVDRESIVYRRPDGSSFHAEVSAAPLIDGGGRLDHAVIAFADVSDRVAAEEAVRQGAKMQALGQLTGGIAHDFNNLLTPMVGGLDIIAHSTGEERTRKIAENALRSAERGARLTAQLLAFSRTQRLELRPTLIAPLALGMEELLSSTLGPSVRIHYDLGDSEPVPVLADPTQLELMILNLAINARDAMPEGGDLTISTRRRQVAEGPEIRPGDYVELSVADTGKGMPPEVAERAFDPFFTTKERGRGTGLGLSMVYGVARQSGGTSRIESSPGTGTRVSVLFPISAGADSLQSAETDAAAAAAETSQRSVLVVEDDPEVRAFLVEALADVGHRVIEAEDGIAALARIHEEPVELMVLDFAMPGLNGAEVAIEARRIRQGQKVLFVTGYADAKAIESAAPDAPVLRKPFTAAQLIRAVNDSLRANA